MKLSVFLEQKAGLTGKKLELAVRACEDNVIETIQELRELDEKHLLLNFPQTLIHQKISNALAAMPEEENSDAEEETPKASRTKLKDEAGDLGGEKLSAAMLPSSKRFHYFLSHKKQHTRFGRDSETLALKFKDLLSLKFDLKGWFDADNLQRITLEKLSEGIAQSCCILLFLNDETLSSTWCVHECKEARKLGIPIIPLIDSDLQPWKQVVDEYMAQGYAWLFDEQAVQYSAQGREKSYELVAEAILRAVAFVGQLPKKQIKAVKVPSAMAEQADVHGSSSPVDRLKAALIQQFGSAEEAFAALNNDDGVVGKREWKRTVARLLPSLSEQESKKLRKLLPKNTDAVAFTQLMSADGKETEVDRNESEMKCKGLAKLPDEVPELPPSFRRREHAQEKLLQALLASAGARSTAVTAPKSRISSQGMGGVGKTMLTAAVVRSESVRSRFKVICWLNLSQQPDISRLQQRLHEQLSADSKSIPKELSNTVEQQKDALEKAAAKQTVLIVLDDMWDSQHQQHFDAMDPETSSKLLVTTRIKNVLSSKGVEVELELLGLQESVELLSGVAELDVDSVPPACLEIAQLCGRLPLCLNIVGKLIRSYGSDNSWIEEVPNLIKRDMKSLTDKGGGSAPNLNLQQRVIQSGLDSINDDHAESIVALFKAFAVFAEDQIVAVAIVSVLFTSLKQQTGKLSAIILRQWLSELLSRSILIGSVGEGVGMHDIVRDFTLGAHTAVELRQLQRNFTLATLEEYSTAEVQSNKAARIVRAYATSEFTHHLKGALMVPLCDDEIAQRVLLHDDDIVDQALQSLKRSDVVDLAEWFATAGKAWSSCVLYSSIAFKCRGVELQDKRSFMRKCLSELEDHVPSTQKGATKLKAVVLTRFFRSTTDKAESTQCLERMIEWSRSKDNPAPPRILLVTGIVLLGVYPSLYAIHRTREHFIMAADLLIKGALGTLQSLIHLPPNFSKMNVMMANAFSPIFVVAGCSASPTFGESTKLILGDAGERMLKVSDMYVVKLHHERVVASSQQDYFLTTGNFFPSFFSIYADVSTAGTQLTKWVAIDEETKPYNLQRCNSVHHVYPFLEIMRPGTLHKVMNYWGAGFANALQWAEEFPIPLPAGRYTIEDEDGCSAWAAQPESCAEYVKAMFATQVTDAVNASEVEAWLPDVDYRPVHDRSINEQGLSATLSTLLAMAAVTLGAYQAALQYNRHWLGISLNPLKDCHACAHLGSVTTMVRDNGSGY